MLSPNLTFILGYLCFLKRAFVIPCHCQYLWHFSLVFRKLSALGFMSPWLQLKRWTQLCRSRLGYLPHIQNVVCIGYLSLTSWYLVGKHLIIKHCATWHLIILFVDQVTKWQYIMRPWMKEIVQHIKVNNVENVIVNKEGRILKVWFGVICMNKWGKLVRETEH